MAHETGSHWFVHSAPGAVDCWDGVTTCRKCGREYVEVHGKKIKKEAYFAAFPKGTVRSPRRGTFLPVEELEECELLIVKDVLMA